MKDRPKWALTDQQAEEVEDMEVDDLLNFANDLDYENYINDFEVRQAIEIMKSRIDEIK